MICSCCVVLPSGNEVIQALVQSSSLKWDVTGYLCYKHLLLATKTNIKTTSTECQYNLNWLKYLAIHHTFSILFVSQNSQWFVLWAVKMSHSWATQSIKLSPIDFMQFSLVMDKNHNIKSLTCSSDLGVTFFKWKLQQFFILSTDMANTSIPHGSDLVYMSRNICLSTLGYTQVGSQSS